jgi:ribonucleoside-diphosphate reductase beta chain
MVHGYSLGRTTPLARVIGRTTPTLDPRGRFSPATSAYVYFLRSEGLLNGLVAVKHWASSDESAHMNFAFDLTETSRADEPRRSGHRLTAPARRTVAEVDGPLRADEDR